MKVETTLISVSRGDVFKYTKESSYGRNALLIIDADVDNATQNVPFVSCSKTTWCGTVCWLDSLLKSGDIVYLGTIDNITNNQQLI